MTKEEKYFIAGFIAGEGCFAPVEVKKGTQRKWFQFCIDVHSRDKRILLKVQKLIGGGTVRIFPSKPNMVRYQIGGIYQLKEKVIPFCDNFLLWTYKKKQYQEWKKEILSYALTRRKGGGAKPKGNKLSTGLSTSYPHPPSETL